MAQKTYNSKVLNKENLTADVIRLTVAKPEGFNYIAGQFTQFYVPDTANAGKEVVRSYSLASTPADTDLTFYIKLVENGKAGEYLKKIQVGDSLKIGDPIGRFVNTDPINPLYFVATGVGLSPMMGIIQDELINKKTTQPIHLLFGVRSEKDIFLTDILDSLKEKYKNFDYKLTLSQPSENWKGAKGRVTNHLPKEINKDSHCFICGNMPMINEVNHFMETQGLAKTNVHFEAF